MGEDTIDRTTPSEVPSAGSAPDLRRSVVPVWAWVVIGLLAAALLAVSIALLVKLRNDASKAQAAAQSDLRLVTGLVAGVATTNQQVSELNKQLETISSSAKSTASSAQGRASAKKNQASSKQQSKGGR
jgi:hypothetical protein